MGGGYFSDALVFLIQILFGAYILAVMLRFLLQLVRADFYNPISQFIVKITTPVLRPIRRIIPGLGGIDFASLLLMWLLQAIELMLIIWIKGTADSPWLAFGWAIPQLVDLLINVFLFSILIQVVLSWVNPGGYNPAIGLLHAITDPLLRPARRLIPPMGGLDLSPMVVMVGLVLLKMLLVRPLRDLFTILLS